ncbi:MAG: sigma-E factor negative regulatory protein, partial [Nevskiales bacterium]|nr:sigma-E factor negative regulatory protein [Nevskiales bacterium]
MTEETLSALLDGECSPAELNRLLEAMTRDSTLKERYSRLCLARESRLGVRFRSARLDFPDRIMTALQDERAARIIPFRLPQVRWTSVWRPLSGLAAAAAVGALAVLAVKPQPSSAPPLHPAAGSETVTAEVAPAAGP